MLRDAQSSTMLIASWNGVLVESESGFWQRCYSHRFACSIKIARACNRLHPGLVSMSPVVNPPVRLVPRARDEMLEKEELATLGLFQRLKRLPPVDRFPGSTVLRRYLAGSLITRQGDAGGLRRVVEGDASADGQRRGTDVADSAVP